MTPADWYLTALLITAGLILAGLWAQAWLDHRADCRHCSRWSE